MRSRLPVAAKMAFATAGIMVGVLASPIPPGAAWLERIARTYPACVWLNPVAEHEWEFTQTIRMVRQLIGGRMYPLTIEGLDGAMRELGR